MPLGGNHALLVVPLRFLDSRLQVGKIPRLRPRRKIFQLPELDLLLFRDNQRLDVLVYRCGNPRHAAASAGAFRGAPIILFEFSPPVAPPYAEHSRATLPTSDERRKQVDSPV